MDLSGINQRPDDVFALSELLLTQSQAEPFPHEIEVLGLPFTVHANVFSPRHLPGAETFAPMLPFTAGMDFLEIGPGVGVIPVIAARTGARVVAIDVNPDAVANTRANARKHGLARAVDVREGDLFAALRPGERFDLVFWNFPFGYVEPGLERTPLQKSTLDPGYADVRRYVTEGRRWLKPGGRLTLGFSEMIGRRELVDRIAAEAGLAARTTASSPPNEQHPYDLVLIDLEERRAGE